MAEDPCKKYADEVVYWQERFYRLEEERQKDPGSSYVPRFNRVLNQVDEPLFKQVIQAREKWEAAEQKLTDCRDGKLPETAGATKG